tara:strand:+ start:793 stop:1095 length:303 start_codon:yes stop_codon:yes gene_type:complete
MTHKYKIIDNKKIDLTEDEIATLNANDQEWENGAFDRSIKDLRQERNELLVETDWMANSDVIMSDDWKTYRQQLRDITNGITTVEDIDVVVFPTKPGEEE